MEASEDRDEEGEIDIFTLLFNEASSLMTGAGGGEEEEEERGWSRGEGGQRGGRGEDCIHNLIIITIIVLRIQYLGGPRKLEEPR